MNLTFTGHRIVLQNLNNNVIISSENRIICFAINTKYIALCKDWEYLKSLENVSIYNLNGKLLFNLESPPKSLYKEMGYYSVLSFKSENILTLQSGDYRYEYDLIKRKFIKEDFTK